MDFAAGEAQADGAWLIFAISRRQRDHPNGQWKACAALTANDAVLEALFTNTKARGQNIEHVTLGGREAKDGAIEPVWVHLLQDLCPCSKVRDSLVHGSVCLGKAR